MRGGCPGQTALRVRKDTEDRTTSIRRGTSTIPPPLTIFIHFRDPQPRGGDCSENALAESGPEPTPPPDAIGVGGEHLGKRRGNGPGFGVQTPPRRSSEPDYHHSGCGTAACVTEIKCQNVGPKHYGRGPFFGASRPTSSSIQTSFRTTVIRGSPCERGPEAVVVGSGRHRAAQAEPADRVAARDESPKRGVGGQGGGDEFGVLPLLPVGHRPFREPPAADPAGAKGGAYPDDYTGG